MRVMIAGLLVWFLVFVQLTSAQSMAPGDWQHFNRDAGSSRYSPLEQITVDNVAGLQLAWSYPPVVQQPKKAALAQALRKLKLKEKPAGAAKPKNKRPGRAAGAMARVMAMYNIPPNTGGVGLKAVPVVVNGMLYVPAGKFVAAVDASSGEEIWRYTLPDGATATMYGVNYWPGTQDVAPRIFFTARHKLFALDAAKGRPVPGFGKQGIVDMGVEWHGVPVVFGTRSRLAP